MGRVSKYTDDMPDRLLAYFKNAGKLEVKDGRVIPGEIPTLVGFIAGLEVVRATFYGWIERHDELREAYDICTSMHEHTVVNGALRGFYAASPSIFYMKNKFGYRNEVEVKHSSIQSESDLDKLTDAELEQFIQSRTGSRSKAKGKACSSDESGSVH